MKRQIFGVAVLVSCLLGGVKAEPGEVVALQERAQKQQSAPAMGAQPNADDPAVRSLSERLEALEGARRVLLIFAPSRGDERFGRQRLIAQRHGLEFADHEIVVIEAAASGREADKLGLQDLRRRFEVADDAFTVVLLDKDGETLLRRGTPVEAETILAAVTGH